MSVTPYSIKTADCGAVLDSTGNCCFYLSVLAGIISLLKEGFSLRLPASLKEIMSLGGWPETRKGTMVDTDTDNGYIEALARALGIQIFMGVMIDKDTIDAEKTRVYGTSGPAIGVVQLKGCAHFVMFKTDFELLDLIANPDKQRRREREFKARMEQDINDSLIAARLAEQEVSASSKPFDARAWGKQLHERIRAVGMVKA
jgi:hypothetical protein